MHFIKSLGFLAMCIAPGAIALSIERRSDAVRTKCNVSLYDL